MFYDESKNKISVYMFDKWTHFSIEEGVKHIVETIQENFWNMYEYNLIRTKMKNIDEHLSEYYKYLAAFDILPYVDKKTNNEIMYDIDDRRHGNQCRMAVGVFEISTRFMKIYTRVKDEMDPEFKRDIFEKVFAIIRESLI